VSIQAMALTAKGLRNSGRVEVNRDDALLIEVGQRVLDQMVEVTGLGPETQSE